MRIDRISTRSRRGRRTARAGLAVALALAGAALLAGAARAQEEEPHIAKLEWTFAGPFGQYDQTQLQRGFKIFREVCSACHSFGHIAFRNLESEHGPNFSEAAVDQIASEYQVTDGPNDSGEMFERPARPADHFPPPFPNAKAAAAANNGAVPPDLSMIAKARAAHRGFPGFVFDIFTQYQEAGPDYIHALLTGYREPPEGEKGLPGQYYNPVFLAGNWLSMPPPLSDGQIEYTDGTPETVEQYSKDISAFLMWAAEPKLEQRKELGLQAMIFLIVLAVLLYLTKRKIWRNVEH